MKQAVEFISREEAKKRAAVVSANNPGSRVRSRATNIVVILASGEHFRHLLMLLVFQMRISRARTVAGIKEGRVITYDSYSGRKKSFRLGIHSI